MSAAQTAVGLAAAACVLLNLLLLLTLLGVSTDKDQSAGNRVWWSGVVLIVWLYADAVILSQLGHHFGF